MNLITKPYRVLLLLGCLYLLISLLPVKKTLDLHIAFTYFLVNSSFLFLTLAGLHLSLWSVYKWTRPFANSKILTWTHIILSTLISVGLVIIYIKADQLPIRYTQIENWAGLEPFENTNREILLCIIVLSLSQLILIANIVIGYLQRKSIDQKNLA